MALGVVVGLASEAACLPKNGSDLLIGCAGASSERAETEARRLAQAGCKALLSFGVAGALAPDLVVGDLIIATDICSRTGPIGETDTAWRTTVFEALGEFGNVHTGAICGSDKALASELDKTALYGECGALGVDMESHRVARVAEQTGLPFLALRIISDRASEAIPSAALNVIGADGRPHIGKVLVGLMRHPGQLPELMRLSKNMNVAERRLRHLSQTLGPLIGFG